MVVPLQVAVNGGHGAKFKFLKFYTILLPLKSCLLYHSGWLDAK